MNDFSPETNRLLGLAREAGGLSGARRARIKAGLLTQVVALSVATPMAAAAAGSSGGASAAGGAATAGKVAWLSTSLGKLASALALFSAAGAGVYASVQASRSHAPVAPTASSAAVVVPALSAAAPVARAPADSEPAAPPADSHVEKAPPNVARPSAALAPVVSAETLSEETRLLRDADRALRAGNAASALALLNEHASRFPRGVLAPERAAESLIARCQLGQANAKAAHAYLAGHAGSAFAARIRDACGVTEP